MDIYYIDRKTGEKRKEIVAGARFLQWIYDTIPRQQTNRTTQYGAHSF